MFVAYIININIYLGRSVEKRRKKLRTVKGWMAVWLSGNALASINVVALRQTRLVPGCDRL